MKIFSNSKQRPSLFLLGAAHLDRRAKAMVPFRPAASNPGVMVESPGGAAFNAAIALRALGCTVCFVSARGGGDDGERVAAAIEALDLTDLSVTFLDRATPTYTAILDETGELVAGIADMALYDRLGPRLLQRRHLRDALETADALLVDANLPAETIAAAVSAAGSRPVAAIGVSPWKVRRLLAVLPSLAAIFLSRAEAAALADVDPDADFATIAAAVARLGAKRAVISDGPRAAAVIDHGRLTFQQPLEVTPTDVTGAGDTLAAVALASAIHTADFVACARLGLAAAAVRVSAPVFPPADFDAAIDRMLAELPESETNL
ncbi:carbohydrate kinase family protein [Jiella sp. MQZ9-1]|uniref:Carbohydrate kinase family protein n=1 Tax=Jiella flava TaxID=2816857 RepID=A0A939JSA6_9HYPH|nr:carbohydrate kinase family protein [Jiella flava]MBO0662763.1 carbohydrate kinase family protein [Jiella flava]MCD2471185.1 carbohydrate kinase family protein [Jiella flava]